MAFGTFVKSLTIWKIYREWLCITYFSFFALLNFSKNIILFQFKHLYIIYALLLTSLQERIKSNLLVYRLHLIHMEVDHNQGRKWLDSCVCNFPFEICIQWRIIFSSTYYRTVILIPRKQANRSKQPLI